MTAKTGSNRIINQPAGLRVNQRGAERTNRNNRITIHIARTEGEAVIEARLADISQGGFGFETATALEPGELQFRVNGEWHKAAVTTGFAEVLPEKTILLAAAVEHPEEIDLKRAEAAKARAEERLRQKRSMQEYYQSQAALSRATARLRTLHR